jgi:hypothetical protein
MKAEQVFNVKGVIVTDGVSGLGSAFAERLLVAERA